jgi:hypothetical protein
MGAKLMAQTKRDAELHKICDALRKSNKRIRHVGYYDRLGRIQYDSIGYETALEDNEEMHILNGTVASMLNLWRPSSSLIGDIESFIMIRKKIVGLIVPLEQENYLLAIFEAKTPIDIVEKLRSRIQEEIKKKN